MKVRSGRGFTLLEVLVSTTILMFVALVAVQMLAEAGRLFGSAQIELTSPSADLTTRWLRRDVQGASELGSLSFQLTSGPLELRGHREGVIRYERVGDELERVLVAPNGEEMGRRTTLRGVSGWQWRALSSGVVEVQIVWQRRSFDRSTRRDGSPVDLKVLTEQRWFALRGRPRRSW